MGGNLKAKCSSCAGAAGIALCSASMMLSGVGIVAVGISQGSGMAGMGGQLTIPAGASLPLQAVLFLTSFWGAVIVLISIGLMAFGMWSAKKVKPLMVALLGATILFFGMYGYFSIPMQVGGAIVLAVGYATAYSRRVALRTRMV